MLPNNTIIYASFHPNNENIVLPILKQIFAAGWQNILIENVNRAVVLELIQQSGMVLVFLCNSYVTDDQLLLDEFAYAAIVARKPYIPIWLDSLTEIQQTFNQKGYSHQFLGALEMLTAKYKGTTKENLISVFEQFELIEMPYTPSTPQICEKPCDIYEGDESYIFISYAHDDAKKVYPIVKELYESGWDLWYDQGIKTTERFIPVTAYSLKCCSAFVLMLTSRCLERPFVMNYELEYARWRGIPIIPVLIEDIELKPWLQENIDEFMEAVIVPDKLFGCISTVTGLVNRGAREAVPPAIKNNVINDVVLPPKLPGFEFSVENDKITIIKYIGDDTEVIIPSTVKTFNGNFEFRVVAIENNAFDNCEFVKHITIPVSITNLCFHVFQGSKSLVKLIVSDSVKYINRHAEWDIYFFVHRECPKLDVVFNASKTIIFHYPENGIKTVYCIPDTVTRIDNGTFKGCKSLKSIFIPKSVVAIGNNTPWGGVNNIDDFEGTFNGCTSLSSINVEIDNELYSSQDGVLFDKKKETLYYYPNGKVGHYTIPHSVKNIKESAFRDCSYLSSITIPNGLIKIESYTFKNCVSLTNVEMPESVVTIDSSAFMDCKSLKNIFMPNKVTTIASHVFCGCESLTSIVLPNSVTVIGECAFTNCTSLVNINIPPNIVSVGANAFANTPIERDIIKQISYSNGKNYGIPKPELLTQEYIPTSSDIPRALICCTEDDVRYISGLLIELYWEGYNFFYETNTNLQVIKESSCILVLFSKKTTKCKRTINTLKEAIDYDASRIIQIFIEDCDWPNEVKAKLYDRQTVFINRLTKTDFVGLIRASLRQYRCILGHPRGFNVRNLDTYVEIVKFNPTDFPYVIIPKTFFDSQLPVMSIGKAAFYWNCSSVKGITIPDTVVEIGSWAFYYCSSLISVFIPKNVINIGERAFWGCTSLSSITVDSENVAYTSIQGVLFNKNLSSLIEYPSCKLCKKYVVPNSVINIETSAFRECENLISIIIQDGIKAINDDTFYGCSSLKSIIIPNTVTTIGKMAFMNCFSLTSITIPNSVKSIEKDAFVGCNSITIYTEKNCIAWKYATKKGMNCKAINTHIAQV